VLKAGLEHCQDLRTVFIAVQVPEIPQQGANNFTIVSILPVTQRLLLYIFL
jgi:hypothetical protein